MSTLHHLDQIFDAALKLADEDRLALADRLLESLPSDLPGLDADDPEFHAELIRRSGDETGSVAWDELRDESRAKP